jgi:type 1 glutamine amidotransferase
LKVDLFTARRRREHLHELNSLVELGRGVGGSHGVYCMKRRMYEAIGGLGEKVKK